METRHGTRRLEAACPGPDMLGCNAAAPTQQVSHTLEEAKSLFADAMSQAGAGNDELSNLPSSYSVHHVEESLKRKGVLSEPKTTSAVPVLHHTNNPRPGDVEDEAARFKDRDVSWILSRQDSRKRKMQTACHSALDFSSYEVQMLSSNDIHQLLVEGARLGVFGQAEEKSLEAGCSLEAASLQAAATDGGMDTHLTPEIMLNQRGIERSPSADHTSSSPESPGVKDLTQQGELLKDKETHCTNPTPNGPHMPKMTDGADVVQEHVTQKGRDKAPNSKEKTTTKRKRKYMPKIRTEKPRASRAKKPRKESSTVPVNALTVPPIEEIPEVMCSPSLLQMKFFARINQRYPKLRKRSRKVAPAISKASLAAENPLPIVHNIALSADFSRFLTESLFADHSIKLGETAPSPTENLAPADADDSLFTHLSTWGDKPETFNEGAQVHVNGSFRSPCRRTSTPFVEEILIQSSVEDPPVDPFLSTCRDFTLVMPPSSPPSPHGGVLSDAVDLWDSFEIEPQATSVRRTLAFDAAQLEDEHVEPWLHKCHMNQLNHQSLVEQAAEIDSTERSRERSRERELRMVAYDDGSKKMVVYKKTSGGRRIKYKPKVNLDFSTKRMFKMLTIKGTSEDEAGAAQEKDSWEQARQQWHCRALRFIAIMREVQGSRAFSRWKGSVVDSVGGAFLTQNVSDFLSSNAFISLRARFPARTRTSSGGGTEKPVTSPAKEQPAPVEKEAATSIPCPRRATIVELKKQQMEDEQRQEEALESVATSLNSANENENDTSVELSETDVVEVLRTALNKCHIVPKDASTHELVKRTAPVLNHEETDPHTNPILAIFSTKEEQVVIKQTKESNEDVQAIEKIITSECTIQSHLGAMDVEAVISFQKEELHLNPATGIAMQMNHSRKNPTSESVEDEPLIQANNESVEVPDMLQLDCVNKLPGVGEALLLVEEPDGEDKLGSASAWKGNLASTVIQEKFASIVTESVTNLTEVGREKVLAATLRQVLGKTHTTREIGFNSKALKSFKLRPGRAALRKSSDNYRYRHNVSFRLLSGEARASWEAGFVMKCQKAKWEPLRAAILADESYCRDPVTEDCVDWSAVQKASVHEVANVIKNRGQHNALAGRMKAFLDRVHRDQNGSIDLEWIRKLPPDDAKAFLMSFRGVGLKSVECIRLLTLHHPSFPVDTNVGRILVRLGWVPLEPLPEETQLHLLELYPIQSQIQQYIWPRLCTLDQETLYELHYQLITFGKVFCTKSKPNCNACPLRSECKHYASSYASAKLLLKWPEKQEKQSRMLALQGSTSLSAETEPTQYSTLTQGHCIPIIGKSCIPIIEEPRSPEPNPDSIPDIEELPFNVEFDTIRRLLEIDSGSPSSGFSEVTGELCSFLDLKQTLLDLNCEPKPDTVVLPPVDTEMLQPQVLEMNMKKVPTAGNCTEVDLERTVVTVEDGEEEPASQGVTDEYTNHIPSQELILVPPQPYLAPAPKLKNVQRLRTVHFVYELPDNHPLLFKMDKREPDDPCFYLLAIWSPDEVPATIPKINDDDARNPFASCQDNDPEQTVRGTLLIPCKTAMRGYFPLNGTYFQVNEVFADHASSVQPIGVPRTLLWSLRRRFVYFSTAVSNLFKDMSREEIQCCFQKGYVCLRAFDVATRQPKILAPRLHQSGAKIVKAPAPRKGRGRAGKASTNDKPRRKNTKKVTSEAPQMETTEALSTAHAGL